MLFNLLLLKIYISSYSSYMTWWFYKNQPTNQTHRTFKGITHTNGTKRDKLDSNNLRFFTCEISTDKHQTENKCDEVL